MAIDSSIIIKLVANLKKYHLTQYSEKALEGYFRYLSRRDLPGYINRTMSFWLAYDESEEKLFNSFHEDLLNEVKKIIPKMNERAIKEEDFLHNPEEAVRGISLQNTILYIYDCKDEPLSDDDLMKWEEGIVILEEHPEMTRFIITSLSLKEKRFKGAPDIYYRKFRQEIETPSQYTEELIFDRVLSDYQEKGFTADEKFTAEIKEYINTVFSTADLSREPFVQDMIERIWNEYIKLPGESKMLTEKCVPYYRKKSQPPVLKVPNDKEIKVPNIKPIHTHFDDLSGKHNVLILSLSTLPPKGTTYCIAEKGDTTKYQIFNGVSQLEPGTKLFISKLASEGLKPDKIIVLTTNETIEKDKNHNNQSALDVYASDIMEYLLNGEKISNEYSKAVEDKLKDDGHSSPEMIDTSALITDLYSNMIDSTSKNSQNSSSKMLNELNEYLDVQTVSMNENSLQEIMSILNKLAAEKDVNLYIDFQGGSRTFAVTMFSAITLLRDKNVTIKDILTIGFNRNYDIHPIETVNNEFAIVDLVSGIRAFSRYGKVDELKRFLQSRKPDDSAKSIINENELLDIMENIDGYMQINNPEGFESELKNISSKLEPEKYTDSQFKLIVEDLKDAYSPLISEKSTVLDEIKWLGDRAFISSALTFIEDKIPEFMLDKSNHIINVDLSKNFTDDEICKKSGGKNYYRPENNIFNFGLTNKYVEQEKNKFYDELCNYWSRKLFSYIDNQKQTVRLFEFKKDQITKDQSLFKAILNYEENYLDFGAWKNITLENIRQHVNNEMEWEKFKKKYGLNRKGETAANVEFKNRDEIKKRFAEINQEKWNNLRIDVALSYLKNNSFRYEPSNKYHKEILTKYISRALKLIIFSDNWDPEKYYISIFKFLSALLGKKLAILEPSLVDSFDQGDKIKFTNGYSKDSYRFSLWQEVLSFCDNTVSKKQIEMIAEKEVVSVNTEKESSEKLSQQYDHIKDSNVKDLDNSDLVEFALDFAKCRTVKDDLKNDKHSNLNSGECSYKNRKVYIELDKLGDAAHTKEYTQRYKKYFHLDSKGECFNTFVGVLDGDLDDGWLKLKMDGISNEKRSMIDTIVLFYYSLKSERNATNHADENANNHMDYRLTRKAIEVFVELCNRCQNS